MPTFKPPGDCPACDAYVPRGAVACQECGACGRSGWREDESIYDDVDLPEDPSDFDYHAFVDREMGHQRMKRHVSSVWWWAGMLLILAFALALIAPLLRGR
jgi:hypothetical protein